MRYKPVFAAMACLVMLVSTAAADIKISVVSYNDETKEAKILIANTGITEYKDLIITFDDTKPRVYAGSTFKPGTAFILPKVASQGFHTLTVKTADGHVFKQELMFSPSGIERVKTAFPVRVSKEDVVREEQTGNNAGSVKWLLWLLGSVVLIVLLAVIIRFLLNLAIRGKARKAQPHRGPVRHTRRPMQRRR
jgi:hypothetical protein